MASAIDLPFVCARAKDEDDDDVSFHFVLFRFVSFRFVWFGLVWFGLLSFCFVRSKMKRETRSEKQKKRNEP